MAAVTVLVTGGSGLVGEAVRYIIENNVDASFGRLPAELDNEKWIFLSSKDGDLRCLEQTRAIFEKFRPTFVLHLAAAVGGLFKNMTRQADMLHDNLLINGNIIQCAHEFNVKKLVSCLSTCIFPDNIPSYPITEDMLHNGPPHSSNFGYAYAKRIVDVQNRAYNAQYGHCFTSVIPTNVFGPHDNYNLEDSHVIPGLIHKCLLAKKSQSDFVIAGSGRPLRQFIYSRDLARLMIWALREYQESDPIILSVGEKDELSIGHVAQTIATCCGFASDIKFDLDRPDGQYKKTVSNAKLMKYLPSFQFTPFETAMKESAEWFMSNFENCRK